MAKNRMTIEKHLRDAKKKRKAEEKREQRRKKKEQPLEETASLHESGEVDAEANDDEETESN